MEMLTPDLQNDLYRLLLRSPPGVDDPAAHLVWVLLIAKVLRDLQDRAPSATTLLCAQREGLEWLTEFGRSGAYEDTIARGESLLTGFVRHLQGIGVPRWLIDVLGVELWLTRMRGDLYDVQVLRALLDIRTSGNREFLVVSHDPLYTLQSMLGYHETTLARVSGPLWLLGIDPIRPAPNLELKPGIVVFTNDGEDSGCVFMAADES